MSLRVLITNQALSGCSGTEMYVHDLALQLLARGHQPVIYSPKLGPLAERLLVATVCVVEDLARLDVVPDAIHAHHSLPALEALLRFPRAPAIYVCHDWNWVHDTPPQLPRIHRYVAVDQTVRDRLLIQEGIDASRVEVIFNGIDLKRFQPRGPLPRRPRRALALSNYLQTRHVEIIRTACQRHDVDLDAVGAKLGGACERPEELLADYDLVFAKGRCAWESLAVGAAVIVCDVGGAGPLVTSAELPALRQANFGRRLLAHPLNAEWLAEQIARYSAADAALVNAEIRATANLDATVDRLLACYHSAIASQGQTPVDMADDMRAAADFLRRWPVLEAHRPLSPPLETERRPLTERQFRYLIRDELRGQRRSYGMQRLWRSLQRRLSYLSGNSFRR